MNHLLKLAGVVALAGSLGGCVIVAADGDSNRGDSKWRDGHGKAGLVYGAEIGVRAPEVVLTVHSNGCTQREHFRSRVDRNGGDNSFTVTFRRTQEDFCKALAPEGVRLTWGKPSSA